MQAEPIIDLEILKRRATRYSYVPAKGVLDLHSYA
jgi:hypothetical protein